MCSEMTAVVSIHRDLHLFLPRSLQKKSLRIPLKQRRSVKDFIESLGIPHVEIGAIYVNGRPVDFSYILTGGEVIRILPPALPIRLDQESLLRKRVLTHIRFAADVHLGKLKNYLRLLGLDTVYRNHLTDDMLAVLAQQEQRIVLTRDRSLLKRKAIELGYYIRETQPVLQAIEVLKRFDLRQALRPYSLCLRCNARLTRVDKKHVESDVPAASLKAFHEFWRCQGCQQVYWEGSHFKHLEEKLCTILTEAGYLRP